ncbi:MAG: hypothetical protein Q3M24_12300 [Candidatus Electrothrix aestuarii]|uniref:TIGR04255 family protein n=1 Tax=Candidatus Electrothrix aestuarii TaxID=3062594 RepID=A0AAU8LPH2_9BACT|nr:hypothetical protein [Candidatus Electrothrix aestuarii]
MRYKPKKTFFQINYFPDLSFYDNIFKKNDIASYFPDWETDRLKITFRDFDKKHSVLLAHNRTVYESDRYNEKEEEKIIKLISSGIKAFAKEHFLQSVGCKRLFLIKQNMSFSDLSDIITLKFYSESLKSLFLSGINDSSVNLKTTIGPNELRVTIGPMKTDEIPNFIKYNINNHIRPETNIRAKELHDIVTGYPEVSLYIETDYLFQTTKMSFSDIDTFWDSAKKDIPSFVNELVNNLFEEKIK